MAKRVQPNPGSWLRVEALLESGDPEFVDELRRIQDADRLGSFAKVLYNDKRVASRRLLLAYLNAPFNAFRHEAFLKRLFKIAEAAQDDEVMAYFMVGLDRSIRREKKSRNRYDWSTRESWVEEFVRTPRGTAMPRTGNPFIYQNRMTGEPMAASSPEQHERIFCSLFRRASIFAEGFGDTFDRSERRTAIGMLREFAKASRCTQIAIAKTDWRCSTIGAWCTLSFDIAMQSLPNRDLGNWRRGVR